MKKIQTKDEAIETVIENNKNDYHKIYLFAESWVKTQFKWFSVLKGLISDIGGLLSDYDIEWQQAGYYETARELINNKFKS